MTRASRRPDARPQVFYLVRHAEKLPSAADVGLSRRGREDAALLAERMAWKRPTSLHSSPVVRARETADAIARATGLQPTFDARLVERQLVREMLSDEEFRIAWTRSERERDFAPAGGESSRAAGRRLAAALEELAKSEPNQRLVVVTHGGVILDLLRELWDRTANVRAGHWDGVPIPSASVTTVVRSMAGRWRVDEVGRVANEWSDR